MYICILYYNVKENDDITNSELTLEYKYRHVKNVIIES